jgi:hypothetical protein
MFQEEQIQLLQSIRASTGVSQLDLATTCGSRLRSLAASNRVALSHSDLHHRPMRQAPRTSTPTEVLAGLVERVTFHNDETGFSVLRVKARGQRDPITVLGHAAMISAGEFVQASGSWVNDRTHGVQFRASFLKATEPTTIEGIERYLGSGMIRGIGPIYARKLVRTFGEAVFDVIEQGRRDRAVRPDRPRRQAPQREHRPRGEDDPPAARNRSEDRPLSARRERASRLRFARRRRDLDGRCAADAGAVARLAGPGSTVARR